MILVLEISYFNLSDKYLNIFSQRLIWSSSLADLVFTRFLQYDHVWRTCSSAAETEEGTCQVFWNQESWSLKEERQIIFLCETSEANIPIWMDSILSIGRFSYNRLHLAFIIFQAS